MFFLVTDCVDEFAVVHHVPPIAPFGKLMNTLRFLHLSDLHLSATVEHDQQVVLDALFIDIAAGVAEEGAPDAILFTGDLVAKGCYSDKTVDYVKNHFLNPLLKAANLKSDRFFLCPGNHDVDKSSSDPMLESAFQSLRSGAEVNKIIDSIGVRPHYWETLQNYNFLISKLGQALPIVENDLYRSFIFESKGIKVGVASINSAWRASGKANEADYGNLLVGERQVENLSKSIAGCNLRLALIHHSLDYLKPFDKPAVQKAIFKNFDALFHGHNHTAETIGISTSNNNTFISNAGCLFQSREFFNGYSILQVTVAGDKYTWQTKVREYIENRQVFDASLRFAAQGESEHIISKANGITDLLPTENYIEIINEKANCQLLSFSASDVAPKSLHEIFVEPRLSNVSEKQINNDKADGDAIKYLSIRELTYEPEVVVFLGSRESGKTTLLNYLCLKSSDSNFFKNSSHSIYIDLSSMKKVSMASILDGAVMFCGGEYKRTEIKKLLEEGMMVVCFDNLPLHKSDISKVIATFVSTYSKSKFFFAAEEDVEQSLKSNFIPLMGVNAQVVYIHSFNRRQTRDLAEKWFADSPVAVQEKVDSIIRLIKKLQIPRTPFLISVLLWIQERNINFSPKNYSSVIDTFVDGLLEKLTETKDRSSTDSTIKRHYLSELAYAVHESKKNIWSQAELELFTVQYFEQKLLNSSALPFLNELFSKGILISFGDDVCFKFDCFRAFFLAQKINSSESFSEFALSKIGFLKLAAEIDFYTGLHRDSVKFLKKSFELVELERAKLNYVVDLKVFDKIDLKESFLTDSIRENIKNEVFVKRPSVHEQEKFFDEIELENPPALIRNSLEDRKVTNGDDAAEESTRTPFLEYFELLKLSSVVLRNCELVNDSALKRTIYNRLIALWSEVLIIFVVALDGIDKDSEAKLAESFPVADPLMMKYIVKVMIPSVVFSIVKENLGTNKLEVVIKESLNEAGTKIESLLSTMLYVDLNLPNYIAEVEKFVQKNSLNRYVKEIMFFKLMSIHNFRSGVSDAELQRVEKLCADMFIKLNDSGSKRNNDFYKTQFLARLQKADEVKSFNEKKVRTDKD